MNALEKLQKRINALKEAYAKLKQVNEGFKEQIADAASALEENQTLKVALEAAQKRYEACQEELAQLRRELSDKDEEIEKIVAQVEALLAE